MSADTYSMTKILTAIRRPARPVLVKATDHWRLVGEEWARDCYLRYPDGVVRLKAVPDAHPALVAFLSRPAVAA
jgi:hypothetical protein